MTELLLIDDRGHVRYVSLTCEKQLSMDHFGTGDNRVDGVRRTSGLCLLSAQTDMTTYPNPKMNERHGHRDK
jgi:hypothetical protein